MHPLSGVKEQTHQFTSTQPSNSQDIGTSPRLYEQPMISSQDISLSPLRFRIQKNGINPRMHHQSSTHDIVVSPRVYHQLMVRAFTDSKGRGKCKETLENTEGTIKNGQSRETGNMTKEKNKKKIGFISFGYICLSYAI